MGKTLFVNACVRSESRTLVLAKTLLESLGCDYYEENITDGGIKPLDERALIDRQKKIKHGDYSDDIFRMAKRFSQAETVVISAPFWDLSFPSFLKIYFENVLVSGLTFRYANGVPEGLCKIKRIYYVTTAGGLASPDFGFSYVKAVAENFLNVSEIVCFKAEGLDVVGNDVAQIMEEAKEKIRRKRD